MEPPGCAAGAISPESLLRARRPALRTCGLSAQKAAYLKDLACNFADGDLDASRWHALEDELLILELTRVKGIGRWTAEMFLIFHLIRPDVLPLGDVGLQRAMRLNYNGGRALTIARMRKLGAVWAPWRRWRRGICGAAWRRCRLVANAGRESGSGETTR